MVRRSGIFVLWYRKVYSRYHFENCIRLLPKAIFLIALVLVFSMNWAQAAEKPRRNISSLGEFSLTGRIVEINPEFRFVVINLGSVDGLKQGMILNVFQKDEEAAKVKVSKVRRHIAACDIQLVYSGRGIAVGDLVIYKEPMPLVKALKPLESTRIIEVEPIVVDIDAPKYEILRRTLTVFEEFGLVITDSDPTKCTIGAQKNLEAPLYISAVTEWGPYVRDRVYYTAEVTATPSFNRLIIRLRGAYEKEGQLYNHEIQKGSSVYKEAQEMAFTIKDLTE